MQVQAPVTDLAPRTRFEPQTLIDTEPNPAEPVDTGDPSIADASRIASILADEAPTVQEHVVNQHLKEAATVSQVKDAKGVPFDAHIHATDSQGNPAKTTRGVWALKRGRKSGGIATSSPSTLGSIGPAIPTPEAQARTAGENSAILLVTVCTTFGGTEWQPQLLPDYGIDEMQNLRKSFGDYFVAKNMKDIPPGVALSIAVVGYMAPRFTMPVTQSKVSRLKGWIGAKVVNFRRRRGTAQPAAN